MVCLQSHGSKHKRPDKENLNYVSLDSPFYANHQLTVSKIDLESCLNLGKVES